MANGIIPLRIAHFGKVSLVHVVPMHTLVH